MGVLGDGGHASGVGGVLGTMYKTHGAGAGNPGGVCGSSNPVNDVGVTGAGPGGVFGLAGVWGIMFRTLNDSSYPGGGVIGDSSPPSDVGVIGINS